MVPMHAADISASNSLERALKLLEIIGRTPGGLTNKAISAQLHIATSSSSYILSRLERDGYVNRDESGRYKIGLKVLAWLRACCGNWDSITSPGPCYTG